MTFETLFHSMELLLAAAVLMWFFTWPWQTFCIDLSRHCLFELRDRLFTLAANKHIDFKDPLYQDLRTWLNTRIRLSHVSVFSDLVAVVIFYKGRIPEIPTIGDEIDKLENESLRLKVKSIYMEAVRTHIAYMALRSPFILALLMLTAIFIPIIIFIEMVNGGVRAFVHWLVGWEQITDDDFNAYAKNIVK